jgi:hypothetical protein
MMSAMVSIRGDLTEITCRDQGGPGRACIPGQPVTVNVDILARTVVGHPAYGVGLRNDVQEQAYTATLPSFAPNEVRHLSHTFLLPAGDGLYGAGVELRDNQSGITYHAGLSFAMARGTFVANPTPWPADVPAPAGPTAEPTRTP